MPKLFYGDIGHEPPLEPKEEEPTVVHTCAWCREPIYEDDVYYQIDNDEVCEACIERQRRYA